MSAAGSTAECDLQGPAACCSFEQKPGIAWHHWQSAPMPTAVGYSFCEACEAQLTCFSNCM
jgi:hypothetical protein